MTIQWIEIHFLLNVSIVRSTQIQDMLPLPFQAPLRERKKNVYDSLILLMRYTFIYLKNNE